MALTRAMWDTVISFMQESTIGGINSCARSKNWIWRFYWITVFAIGGILTAVQINDILNNYFEYHVDVSNDFTYEPALQFPAVTICNLNRINCVIMYSQIDDMTYELSNQNSSSPLQDDLLALQDMFVQVGCDEQLCTYFSSTVPDVRGSSDYDWMIYQEVKLGCQHIFLDPALLYINDRNCYYLFQMRQYSVTGPSTFGQYNCTLQSACTHYATKIMPLVNSGAFDQQYTTGDGIGEVCETWNFTAPVNTLARRRKRQADWLNIEEASYMHDISVLEDAFLLKFMALEESLRIAIGHQLSNDYMSDTLGVQPGMVTRCTFLGTDCKAEELWYQFSDPTYGNCFTFNSVNNKSGSANDTTIRNATLTGASNGLQLELFVDQFDYMMRDLSPQAGLRVVVHDPQTYPLMDDNGLDLQPGTLSSISVQLTNISRLPDPYESHCLNYWNQTALNQSIMTDNKPQYSMSVCNRFCIQVDIISTCNCYHIQLDMTLINISRVHFNNGSRPCSLLPNVAANPDYACFQNVLQLYEDQIKHCDACELACTEKIYSITSSTSMWPSNQYWDVDANEVYNPDLAPTVKEVIRENYLKAEIYYQTLNVQQIMQSPKVSGSDLYASLGGALGFYLGIAIIMLFELIQLGAVLGFTMYEHYTKKKNKGKKKSTEM